MVLDEADQMLGADFRAELEAVLAALRRAAADADVLGDGGAGGRRRWRGGSSADALRIELGAACRASSCRAVAVARADREAAVVNLLRLHEARAAIVFCGRREAAGPLAERLAARGFAVVALSGALSQAGRNAALAAMREGRARVCVATDLAARGFDLPGLELVLHADLPGSAEMLLHRSGRTGRAGRGGLAVLVVTPGERRRAEALAGAAGPRDRLDGGAGPGGRSPPATSSGCWRRWRGRRRTPRRPRRRRGFWPRMGRSGSPPPTGGSGRRRGRRRAG